MNTASRMSLFAGGFISAAAGVWSEKEQVEALDALRAWVKMIEDELREKQQTMLDVMAPLDMHDEEIAARVRSDEYQSLLKKVFRNWAEPPRVCRKLHLLRSWSLRQTRGGSIGELYKREDVTRRQIWESLGRERVREDSADADLYKFLIRDFSTGRIIRQHRETDYHGNFINRTPHRSGPRSKPTAGAAKVAKSAFDDEEQYELTALGKQFVHYAMTDLALKLQYRPDVDFSGREGEPPSQTPLQPMPGDAG